MHKFQSGELRKITWFFNCFSRFILIKPDIIYYGKLLYSTCWKQWCKRTISYRRAFLKRYCKLYNL